MESATELMRYAAHYRRLANAEKCPRLRDKLMQIAADYDSRACAKMVIQENAKSAAEWLVPTRI